KGFDQPRLITTIDALAAERDALADRVVEYLRGGIALAHRIDALTAERDAALLRAEFAEAHDTQPYPTAEAYERVCALYHRYRETLERIGDGAGNAMFLARA